MKLDLLVFGAHPDDAEIGMGGAIKKHTSMGLSVGICDLTQAELSSNGTVEERKREARRAADILGLSVRTNLLFPDRGLAHKQEYIERITEEIRKWRPKAVFAPYWEDRHPDHAACSLLVQEAVFNAKLRKYLPDIPAHQVNSTWFYFINNVREPDAMIDVTAYYEAKREALSAYSSQFWSTGGDSVETPLTRGYLERVESRDSLLGQSGNLAFAEGFMSKLPLMIDQFA